MLEVTIKYINHANPSVRFLWKVEGIIKSIDLHFSECEGKQLQNYNKLICTIPWKWSHEDSYLS